MVRFILFFLLLVFSLNSYSQNWLRMGADIDGEADGDQSGYSVSFSSDGTIVAIGAPNNNTPADGSLEGHVRVYQYINNTWTQLGSDIDGEGGGDRSGHSVSLSSDGTIVAVGAWGNDGNAADAGHVRIYQYSDSTWTQLGSDIDGDAADDKSGWSISLSSDGSKVAIGAIGSGNVGSGRVRVYEYTPCPSSNLQGTFNAVTTYSDMFCSKTSSSRSFEWVKSGADNLYAVVDGDFSYGGYGACDRSTNPGGNLKIKDDCGVLSIVGVSRWGETYTFNDVSTSSDKKTLTLDWKNSYGESGVSVLTDWSNGDWPDLTNTSNPYLNTWTKKLGQDIDGEASNDGSGQSVSLSSDGTKVAIGAHWNDGNGDDAGHVRVYQYASNTWTQIGSDIDGEGAADESGSSVSLSGDGTKLAIGAPRNNGVGHVRIYEYTNNTWTKIGSDIDGVISHDQFGTSVSLSSDGTKVAIGAIQYFPDESKTGYAHVYEYSNNSWTKSFEIDGELNGDEFGYSVSLSSDGTKLAIAAPDNDGNGENSGHVVVYQYQTTPITVKQDGSGNFTTITAAVDAASDGSTIIVSPGTYTENISIKDKSLTLKSSGGPATTIIKPSNNSVPILWLKGSLDKRSTIEGFTLKDAGNQSWGDPRGSALKINNSASATVINVIFADADQQPFAITSGGTAGPAKLYNCIFYGTKQRRNFFWK